MSDSALTLEKIFRDAGFLAKWEAEGEARGIAVGEARGIAVGVVEGEERKATEIAKNMLRNGFSLEQTSTLSGLDVEKVKALSN
jgi:predicted transposase YdaD